MATDTTGASEVGDPSGLGSPYAPVAGELDEMVMPDGGIRAHWQPFVDNLAGLGRAELLSRRDHARRLIRENGITYNAYDDPDQPVRPWSLDLLPMLLPSAEWAAMGTALTQRARVLDALIADLYGPKRVLADGVLPPELVYANRGYLRQCQDIRPVGGRWLHLYAAELVRDADGTFRVVGDRTQSPSGAGYSLENRIVTSRVLPEAFARCNVLRLAPFFIAVRRTLASLAVDRRENPRVVLLTPGPFNEAYFEHAYLARYLGYTLVQGSDLTVRDARVYLKTLGGLQRVDVILRRVDDAYCDPLELYAGSYLGVAGLLEAVRCGNVSVANALGTGVAEIPALLPFLPGVSRHLLGEELKLDSIRTWWCGQKAELKYVLENLEQLIIIPAMRYGPVEGARVDAGALSREKLSELSERIRARPSDFVAHEHPRSYRAPVYLDGSLEPRRIAIRAQLAATESGYTVMPGGLTRFPSTRDGIVFTRSYQKGGGTKDTWITGDAPVPQVTLLEPPSSPLVLTRGGGEIPSRVADDLFWLGRYVQRAQGGTRLVRCVMNRLADPNSMEDPAALGLLLRELFGSRQALSVLGAGGLVTPGDLAGVVFSKEDRAGLRNAARSFYGLMRTVRDRISADAWRILQGVYRQVTEFSAQTEKDQPGAMVDVVGRMMKGFLAFEGMAAESMTRGQLWRFLDMGMRVERAISTARLLQSTLVEHRPGDEHALLDALLEVGDCALTYRRRYLNRLEVAAAADLIVADDTNPRSILFQVMVIREHLRQLPRESWQGGGEMQASLDVQMCDLLIEKILAEDFVKGCAPVKGRREKLGELLGLVMFQLSGVSELLGQVFFSHAAVEPRPLGGDDTGSASQPEEEATS